MIQCMMHLKKVVGLFMAGQQYPVNFQTFDSKYFLSYILTSNHKTRQTPAKVFHRVLLHSFNIWSSLMSLQFSILRIELGLYLKKKNFRIHIIFWTHWFYIGNLYSVTPLTVLEYPACVYQKRRNILKTSMKIDTISIDMHSKIWIHFSTRHVFTFFFTKLIYW